MRTTNRFSPQRPRPARGRYALVLALLATVSLSACGGADEDGDEVARPPATNTQAQPPNTNPASGDQDAGASDGTSIRIAFGDAALTARLHDNATAHDLDAQLPLTLTFRDHNNVEKTAPLPRELSLDGAPEGHDPAAGEIGYWAPDGDLVFYYDSDAPFFNGIVRIGEFDGDMDALARQRADFSVTIERASNAWGGSPLEGHSPGLPAATTRVYADLGMDTRDELREFLTSRRAGITPEKAGLPSYGARRVPGLRREEVAILAGVSVDYYTRLERGDLSGASDSVLEALGRALQLDDAEHNHLFDLARAARSTGAPRRRRAPKRAVRPSIQHLLDGITGAAALVHNARLDNLAGNQLGRALYSEMFAHAAGAGPVNSARYVFLEPHARELYADDWNRAVWLPSTTMAWPIVNAASSEQRPAARCPRC